MGSGIVVHHCLLSYDPTDIYITARQVDSQTNTHIDTHTHTHTRTHTHTHTYKTRHTTHVSSSGCQKPLTMSIKKAEIIPTHANTGFNPTLLAS
jgi:carbohydrate-binding DOMON domain-containing protein